MMETIELIGLAFIPAFLLLDLVVRRRRFVTPRWWRVRMLAVGGANFFIALQVGLFWGRFAGDYALLDGAALGALGGAVVGVAVYELVHYWYHRTVHRSDTLFRWVHQMHHSAEGLDAFSAYYMHPIDAALFTTWSSIILFPVLGLAPIAGALAVAFLTFNAMFQHANIRTPRWVGYIVQRPESHGIHHERGVHRYNYSDLPLWDMVFGTFRNPATFDREVGFHEQASPRIGAMLIGRDVTRPVPAHTAGRADGPALEHSVDALPFG